VKLVISNLVNRLFITYDNKPKALQRYVVMHAHLILVSNLNHTYILKGMAPVRVKLGLGLYENKKLSYRRGTARCVVSIEILPIATQQRRNYLYDKSWPNRWYEVGDLVGAMRDTQCALNHDATDSAPIV